MTMKDITTSSISIWEGGAFGTTYAKGTLYELAPNVPVHARLLHISEEGHTFDMNVTFDLNAARATDCCEWKKACEGIHEQCTPDGTRLGPLEVARHLPQGGYQRLYQEAVEGLYKFCLEAVDKEGTFVATDKEVLSLYGKGLNLGDASSYTFQPKHFTLVTEDRKTVYFMVKHRLLHGDDPRELL